MRYVIIDCGPVGQELARRWTAAGHHVLGTTPDPAELPRVAAVCAEAMVISHGDGDRIREVAGDADGAVLAVRPQFLDTRPTRERVTTYRQSIISVVRAAGGLQRRLVLFSSIAVYGDGGDGGGPVTERTPVTTSLDPAAQSFAAVERMVLESPEATVLRLPDAVTGHPGAMSGAGAALFGILSPRGTAAAYPPDYQDPTAALRALHDEVGGALPFDPAALMHVIDYRDAAAATAFVMEHDHTGVFNVVPDTVVPPTAAVIGKLAADAGLPFTFTATLPAPTRPISSAKLRAAGFTFSHG